MASSSNKNDAWMQAVQAGDVIRRHSPNLYKTSSSSSNDLSPGVLPGALAVVGTALVTWPMRQSFFRLVDKHNNKQFQMFLELVITPIQVLTVLQAGLFVGSIYGSHAYLQQFLRVQQHEQENIRTELSSTATAAVKDTCRELLAGNVVPSSMENDTTSFTTHNTATTSLWNSPTQILQTYQLVLEQCRKDASFEE